jgi:serine/threonine protein phosphatase PrpC
VVANIGDTRVYIFKKNKLAFQTTDHSLAQVAVERGEITLAEIRSHKDQNKLTRVLGSDYYIAPDVEVFEEPVEPGDSFLLCTDGFWEYVNEDEMEEDLAAETDPVKCIRRMEKRLKSRADKYNDNYTVLVAKISE